MIPSPIVNHEQLSRESVVRPEDKEAANLGASLSSPWDGAPSTVSAFGIHKVREPWAIFKIIIGSMEME